VKRPVSLSFLERKREMRSPKGFSSQKKLRGMNQKKQERYCNSSKKPFSFRHSTRHGKLNHFHSSTATVPKYAFLFTVVNNSIDFFRNDFCCCFVINNNKDTNNVIIIDFSVCVVQCWSIH